MTLEEQIKALQNGADVCGLTVHHKPFYQDKRKTVNKFFLQKGNETVSPVLDYTNLNHFILGWIECKQKWEGK